MTYSPKAWALTDPITDVDLNRIETGIDEATATVEDYIADDTGWLTTGVTAASGWSIGSQSYRRVNKVVSVYITLTRTGSAIASGASGDVGNVAVCTLPTGFRPLSVGQGLGAGALGQLCSFYCATTGIVTLAATAPDSNIATNDGISVAGTFLI